MAELGKAGVGGRHWGEGGCVHPESERWLQRPGGGGGGWGATVE